MLASFPSFLPWVNNFRLLLLLLSATHSLSPLITRLYNRLAEGDRAAVLFERYLQETEEVGPNEERGQAYHFLANHCLQKNVFDLAYEYAQKCTLFHEVRELIVVWDKYGEDKLG